MHQSCGKRRKTCRVGVASRVEGSRPTTWPARVGRRCHKAKMPVRFERVAFWEYTPASKGYPLEASGQAGRANGTCSKSTIDRAGRYIGGAGGRRDRDSFSLNVWPLWIEAAHDRVHGAFGLCQQRAHRHVTQPFRSVVYTPGPRMDCHCGPPVETEKCTTPYPEVVEVSTQF